MDNRGVNLFNKIAPVYALFFKLQQRNFRRTIDTARPQLDVRQYETALDVGCGTGALCSVLAEQGLAVTGMDPAARMLAAARKRSENRNVSFVRADARSPFPFDDDRFDLVFASYVAHGLFAPERLRMYSEMRRVAREKVIIHDYNDVRHPLTTIVERMEGGDYERFIVVAEDELRTVFSDVTVIQVSARGAWYVCTP